MENKTLNLPSVQRPHPGAQVGPQNFNDFVDFNLFLHGQWERAHIGNKTISLRWNWVSGIPEYSQAIPGRWKEGHDLAKIVIYSCAWKSGQIHKGYLLLRLFTATTNRKLIQIPINRYRREIVDLGQRGAEVGRGNVIQVLLYKYNWIWWKYYKNQYDTILFTTALPF